MEIDEGLLSAESRKKLAKINNRHVEAIVVKYAKLCDPKRVIVLDDSKEDVARIRKTAVDVGEEALLHVKGHTVHYDGYFDQARDLENTRVMLEPGQQLGKAIRTIDRDEGLKEVREILKGIMKGKDMYVKFYCLGPTGSKFSIPALQITDSLYVLHSTDILYRQGYAEFVKLAGSDRFFHFIHSAGELKKAVSMNIGKRRVYMDLEEERVFTVNNQYAGNSVGLKKLALRLAISKANKDDWLCEHMFITGVRRNGRVTYFTGAFPTACGKTSTAMIPGNTIVGDDIAYIRPGDDGVARAVNVEQGIFGIIKDINPEDDPLIYESLTTPREIIFSNVLVKDGKPYWLGMGAKIPERGTNYSGEWHNGKKDDSGKEIMAAHKNARYTIRINELDNADERADSPDGVPVLGFLYGGRDSRTSVPILQSLSWFHGVFMGAALESETVAGTSDKEGLIKHNPMSNIEFLTVPLKVYIRNHLRFGASLDRPPIVFATNYFLRDEDGEFMNSKLDKKVWLSWAEGRVHGDYEAIETPIGFIPKHEDLKALFKDIFSKTYSKEAYEKQFSIRIANRLSKLDRIEAIFREEDVPEEFMEHIEQQRERLRELWRKHGKEVVSPFEL